jgi:hypothetical protein
VSAAAREDLVKRLSFTDNEQKSDLLGENVTSTWLIAMLQWMVGNCPERIEILAVRSDHPTPDGRWAHSGGLAADLYPKNWEGREHEAVVNVLKSFAENPYCYAVGLGGVTRQWESDVTWPSEKFVVFADSPEDHIHVDAANAVEGPGSRL